MIIGISGKSGSGKSTIAKEISFSINAKLIDVDDLSRIIRDEYREEIVELVERPEIVKDNKIDSKLLGKILFDDKELMKKYNEFVYSKLVLMINKELKENKNVVLDSIFLPIMDVFKKCDYTILVQCDESIRRNRVKIRDNIDDEYFDKRENSAIDYKGVEFDFIVDNNIGHFNQLELILSKIING